MNSKSPQIILRQLEWTLIAFFLLCVLFLFVVYFVDPSIYTQTLLLKSSATDRYPLPATLFLLCIVGFIVVLIVGAMHHWRWLFWLLLIAFGVSVLDIPVTILQLIGVVANTFPLWYSLCRMGVAIIESGIAIWMGYIYLHYGVWAMNKKKTTPTGL